MHIFYSTLAAIVPPPGGGSGGSSIINPAIGDPLNDLLSSEGGAGFLSRLLTVSLTIILIVGSLFFLFMLLTGGIDWIRSGGDKQALESARGKLVSAIIGLVVLFAAWAVFTLLENLFGINLLLIDIPVISNI